MRILYFKKKEGVLSMNLKEHVTTHENKNIHLIPTDKFKTIQFVVKFKAPLTKETITKRALLPYVLRQGTEKYPTRETLDKKLDELYGSGLGIDGSKKGEQHILSFRFEVPNEKFIPNAKQLNEQAISLLTEVINKPLVKDNKFDETVVAREKETLRQRISSIIDDKLDFAQMRLVDEMCKDEKYALHILGYVEDLDDITPKSLYEYYQSVLTENNMDIYVVGDFELADMQTKLEVAFDNRTRNVQEETTYTPLNQLSMRKVKHVVEEQELQQAKLHIGYRTNATFKDSQYAALLVFNGIFGGFPNSKLFMNVREKHSLAYYAASRIESYKGLMFVFSGIAPEDYDKALEIIELQFADMQKGDFTEEILEETKGLLINDYLETLDHPQGIIELFYQGVIANNNVTPEDLIAHIKAVTHEDVVSVGKTIVKDTIYLLTNQRGDQNE